MERTKLEKRGSSPACEAKSDLAKLDRRGILKEFLKLNPPTGNQKLWHKKVLKSPKVLLCYNTSMVDLPNKPGPNKLSIQDHLQELFEIDGKIFNKPPILFPFETKEEFLKFLTKDHKTTVILWNGEGGVPVGYLAYEESLEVPDITELVNIGTLPEY